MVRPWSPIWVVAAIATSSTRSGGSDGLRRSSSRMHLIDQVVGAGLGVLALRPCRTGCERRRRTRHRGSHGARGPSSGVGGLPRCYPSVTESPNRHACAAAHNAIGRARWTWRWWNRRMLVTGALSGAVLMNNFDLAVPVLSRGKHRNPRKGACFMEFASYLAGEPWSDHPACTHPLLAGRGPRRQRLYDGRRPVPAGAADPVGDRADAGRPARRTAGDRALHPARAASGLAGAAVHPGRRLAGGGAAVGAAGRAPAGRHRSRTRTRSWSRSRPRPSGPASFTATAASRVRRTSRAGRRRGRCRVRSRASRRPACRTRTSGCTSCSTAPSRRCKRWMPAPVIPQRSEAFGRRLR